MALTQITEKGIKDGEIVNADISSNTADRIAGSKINPAFTTNIEITNNGPGITFTDTDDSKQFYIQTQGDELNIVDATNSTTKLGISNTGHITLTGNVTINNGYLEVSNSNLYIEENITHAGDGDTRIRFPANDAISLETAGSSRVYIDSNGNTGINISTPQSMLELSAATNTVMGIELGRAGDSITASRYIGICQTNNATNLATNSGFQGVEFGGPASTDGGYLAFHTHDVGVASVERMRIHKSGFIGFGTQSPNRLMHGAGATPILKLDATNNESYIQLVTASPSNESYIGLVDGDIYMSITGTGATGNEKFRIKANGRVGINSGTPSGTLSVFDPNGDNVSLVLVTTASSNFIQLADSTNYHSYIAKEGSQTSFYTANASGNATEKIAYFNSNGLNLIDGKGVNFSAYAQDGANNPYSNNLHDYEEGSWIPAIVQGIDNGSGGAPTYSVQNGIYVKIGRFVNVSYFIQLNTTVGTVFGTGSRLEVGGLPFTIQALNANHNGFGSTGYHTIVNNVGDVPIMHYGTQNTNKFECYSGSNSVAPTNNTDQYGRYLIGGFSYQTNA